MRSRTLLATLIGSAFGAAPAAAQVTAQLWLGAGTIADDRGISATAVSAAPSIAIASPRARLQVGLHGTRFTTGSWSIGAGTSLDFRAPVAGPAALTLGAAAGATRTSHAISLSALEATPAFELGSATAAAFVGFTAAAGRTSRVHTGHPLEPTPLVAETRSAFGPVFGGRAVLASSTRGTVSLGYREAHLRTGAERVVDRTAALTLGRPTLALTALLGHRDASGEPVYGGLRALVSLSPTLALRLAAERHPRNLVSGAEGGRSATLGFVLRTHAAGAPHRPRTAATAADRPGSR